MDDIVGQIVLFALLIGSSILQAVLKKRKKESQSRQYTEDIDYHTFEDGFDEPILYEEQAARPATITLSGRQSKEQPKEYVFSGEKFSKETAMVESPRSRVEEQLRASATAGSTVPGKAHPSPNKRMEQTAAKTSDGMTVASEDDPVNDVVKEFDIRKAVLYSEILNPKFRV
jgi:hypothetical protein